MIDFLLKVCLICGTFIVVSYALALLGELIESIQEIRKDLKIKKMLEEIERKEKDG